MPAPQVIKILSRPVVDYLRKILLGEGPELPLEEGLTLQKGGAAWLEVDGFAWPEPRSPRPVSSTAEVCVVLHLHYPELWAEFAAILGVMPAEWNLIVTLTNNAEGLAPEIDREFPGAVVVDVGNRGRDIGPFFHLLSNGYLDGSKFFLKIHGKRSKDPSFPSEMGEVWRRAMVIPLVTRASEVVDRFRRDPGLGIVGPGKFLLPNHRFGERQAWHVTRPAAEAFFLSRGLPMPRIEFFAGTMFWLSKPAIDVLRELNLTQSDFEDEADYDLTSLAHILERTMISALREAGLRVGTV